MMRLKLSRISHVKAGKQQPSQPDALGAVMLFLHDLAKSSARKIGLAIACICAKLNLFVSPDRLHHGQSPPT